MSLTGEAGAQHYSDEELRVIVDEAHRRGLRVAAHTHGAEAVKHAIACGIDCIEHGFLMDDEAIQMLGAETDRFLVTTRRLAEYMDVSKAPPELQAKAAEMFPKARTSIKAAYEAGVNIVVGTDAPAIPHGKNADELVTLVDWGMPPAAVLRAATIVAADLINVTDRGRLAEGYVADIIAVPGDPLADISVTKNVYFVMKGGKVFRHDQADRTDDLVEIQQLLAKYAVTITQGDLDGLLAVFTPDGTYSAFGTPTRWRVPGAGRRGAQGAVHDRHALVDLGGDDPTTRPAPSRCASSSTPRTTCASATTTTPTCAPTTAGG